MTLVLSALGAVAIGLASPASDSTEALCNAVAGGLIENDPSQHTDWRFESRMYAGAGVHATDPAEVRNEAVRRYWLAVRSETARCEPRQVDLLRLAVMRKNNNFIEEALEDWHLDLNYRDPRDGLTVLDFIAQERVRMAGTPITLVLDRYYKDFRKGGAKLGSELP